MSLDGRVAVVTGATKGVGRGIGRELAQHGPRVFVTGRSAPDHQRLDEQITGEFGGSTGQACPAEDRYFVLACAPFALLQDTITSLVEVRGERARSRRCEQSELPYYFFRSA